MKRNTAKTKLIATIISIVSALCLLAVGVFATLTNFQVAIANQLNLKFDAVEGTLYATRVGDVAGTDRTTSKVLSESSTATDWLKVYDGTTTEGVQSDALTSIQEKVDFISNDKIKEKVNAGSTSIAITYYFYYTLPENAVANNVVLTAPAVSDSNVVVSYSYIKATSSAMPAFTDATTITDGAVVTVSGGEHLFIKAEAKVDLSKSVKIENADWSFTLAFGVSTYSLNGDILTFNAVSGAETYEVWAKQTTTSGTSLLAQTSAVGDTDDTLGTLVKILDKDTTSVNLAEALGDFNTANYKLTVLPKNSSDAEITGNRIVVDYAHTKKVKVRVTDTTIGGNYYYYVELGEYPQTVVEETATLSVLNALGDSAKTGRTFVVGASDDAAQTAHEEYTYNGAKYVKVASAVVYGTDAQYKFSTGTQATSGNTYWFKVEPIKWFLLEAYSTTKTSYTGSTTNLRVISEKLLTSNVMFKKDGGGNDWGTSNIRSWLNNTFYISVFSASDKGHIVKNTTRYFGENKYTTKDDYTTTTGGSTIEDNVWLTSYYEMGNTYYGENMYLNKNTRKATPTDFAVINKVYMNTNGCGWYWLRSAGGLVNGDCSVGPDGSVNNHRITYYTYIGLRPALTISI